ncbi:MAG: hypothetical protein WD751_09685 [Anaerolineales bacterium]
MSQTEQIESIKSSAFTRRITLYVTLSAVFFLIGFVPMWLSARESSRSLTELGQQLRLAEMKGYLASAAIDAQRGDYESARQETSDFFMVLRAEIDNQQTSVLSEAEKQEVQALFAEQDDLITLLARRDPASGVRLANLYVAYRQIVK